MLLCSTNEDIRLGGVTFPTQGHMISIRVQILPHVLAIFSQSMSVPAPGLPRPETTESLTHAHPRPLHNGTVLFGPHLAQPSAGALAMGFRAFLQHVSPKSDFTVAVVSFLNACKGNRRGHRTFPIEQPTNTQARSARKLGSAARAPKTRLRLSGTVGTPSVSQPARLSAWAPFTAIQGSNYTGLQAVCLELRKQRMTHSDNHKFVLHCPLSRP